MTLCPDWEYAKAMEIAAIKAMRPEYNQTAGGDGSFGYRHTEEHKRYMSQKMRGVRHWVGKKHSPETIQKMRESARIARAEGRGGFQRGHTINGKSAKRQGG